MEKKKKVVVAFSGGLDTSFTANVYIVSIRISSWSSSA